MRLSSSTLPRRPRRALQVAAHRLRPRLLAILQTAAAAVLAWQLAAALLPDPRPAFASIAAVIAVGATFGQRGSRAAAHRRRRARPDRGGRHRPRDRRR